MLIIIVTMTERAAGVHDLHLYAERLSLGLLTDSRESSQTSPLGGFFNSVNKAINNEYEFAVNKFKVN